MPVLARCRKINLQPTNALTSFGSNGVLVAEGGLLAALAAGLRRGRAGAGNAFPLGTGAAARLLRVPVAVADFCGGARAVAARRFVRGAADALASTGAGPGTGSHPFCDALHTRRLSPLQEFWLWAHTEVATLIGLLQPRRTAASAKIRLTANGEGGASDHVNLGADVQKLIGTNADETAER